MSEILDMTETTQAKSDQLNAVDLVGAPKTILITGITKVNSETQPIIIDYEGGKGRPYKPCKGFRRGLIELWGKDGKQYVGRSLTLFCNASVVHKGQEVGGSQISHASHIDTKVKFLLILGRGRRTMHTVEPIKDTTKPKAVMSDTDLVEWCESLEACNDMNALSGIAKKIKAENYNDESRGRVMEEYTKAVTRIKNPEASTEEEGGAE